MLLIISYNLCGYIYKRRNNVTKVNKKNSISLIWNLRRYRFVNEDMYKFQTFQNYLL